MNVTDATSRFAGAAWRDLRESARDSRARARRFLRDPVREFQRNVEELPYDYPAATIMLLDVVLLVAATIAMIQRHEYFPSPLPLVAMGLTYVTGPLYAFFGMVPKPVMIGGLAMVATALFLVQPVENDISPLILILAAGEVAAITPALVSVPLTLVMLGQLAFFARIGHLDGALQYSAGVVCGWMTGRMLQYQSRFTRQERETQEVRTARAADEERGRIAREVHDVIAHSLSITLLHVTAARHALQTDRDVDEAVDALADAERLGRQAMADIRRTVGLLDQRPSRTTPEPGLDDIAELVGDFVRAGMAVDYELEGDPATVSAGLGLALYRIGQESLANIAKHAPGTRARLRIVVDDRGITVTVHNTLPAGVAARPGNGMGVRGMRQRAELLGGMLSAGPEAGGWQVRARIPLSGRPVDGCVVINAASTAEDSLKSMFHNMTRKLQEGRADPARESQEGV
ncbi:sensor histidine kinase [Nocardia otitidiscaviarum]|uniref:sensor histidine kinase n=1 Tax=Nocardia otitidiscaviarum TaxID=1823 RepID=UPI00189439B3|nr:histidine kinase [Nocardia otitidiscaviarum]MBF6182724.1 histidine kinase [Nocardia otitidiscaviarum]